VVNPGGYAYVFVNSVDGGEIAVTEVITTLATGDFGGMHVAVDEQRGYVYVSNGNSDSITVFGYPNEPDPSTGWQRFLPLIQR